MERRATAKQAKFRKATESLGKPQRGPEEHTEKDTKSNNI